jgi:diadenosine tetraphosphatase ApaH/serine/threonine PP2A family protein phosphatase
VLAGTHAQIDLDQTVCSRLVRLSRETLNTMKYAILSDLHANRQAIEAVIDDARRRGAQRWALLGDFVGYGADPAWVVDTVRDLVRGGAIAIQGNHDAATVAGFSPQMRQQVESLIQWTRSQLDPDQLKFLADLPYTHEEGDLLFTHANAFAPRQWAYIEGRSEAVRSMMATHCRVTFCGHMHDPRLFHLSSIGKAGEFVPTAGVPVPLMAQRNWLVIPGSAGQPRDGNPAACYAMYDSLERSLTLWRVPYDIETASQRILDAGLPAEMARRLRQGL